MKEFDILGGQNILWPSKIFSGKLSSPYSRIYAPGGADLATGPQTSVLKFLSL